MAQRVLVTAGAAGIGLAMVEAFLARGDRVAICDSDPAALDAAPSGEAALKLRADVTDPGEVAAAFAAAADAWGGLDVVCANAGIGGPAAAIEDFPIEDWRRTVAVNLDGAFLTARAAAALLRPQGSGLILFTSSTAGLAGYPLRAPYCAAKWGVIGLMKTVAMELGPAGVRANAICPGAVDGPRMDRVIANEAAATGRPAADIRAGYVADTSLRTFVDAADIAAMALFLASPAGARVSGQAIAVDGHSHKC